MKDISTYQLLKELATRIDSENDLDPCFILIVQEDDGETNVYKNIEDLEATQLLAYAFDNKESSFLKIFNTASHLHFTRFFDTEP